MNDLHGMMTRSDPIFFSCLVVEDDPAFAEMVLHLVRPRLDRNTLSLSMGQ